MYLGSEVFGVKWRDWKINFKESDTIWGRDGIRTYDFPRLYNLLSDVHEHENVLFPHSWVPRLALVQLDEHQASLQEYPPIPVGALDPYEPPNR